MPDKCLSELNETLHKEAVRFKIGENPNDTHPHTVALRALIHRLMSMNVITTGTANAYLGQIEMIDSLLTAHERAK
jgi:5,10-methylenetetrahydrofolate reductase